MTLRILCFMFASVLMYSSALIADQGIIVRTATLRASTSYVADTVSNLAPGTEVELLERKGGWQKVRVIDKPVAAKPAVQQGWIRGYQVRTNISTQSDDAVVLSKKEGGTLSGLSSLSKSASNLFARNKKPEQNNTVVATIGVRGLSEQDLANAKPNFHELNILQQYAASDQQASEFAKQGKLKKCTVSELDDPDKMGKRKKKR